MNLMVKSVLSFALAGMLAPGLSAAQTVQNFIIDPNPTRENIGITSFFKEAKRFFRGEKAGSLEKIVDYFTSATNPNVVNANGNAGGGIFLYTNDGSLAG